MNAALRLRIGAIAALALLLLAFVSIVWTPYPVDNLSIGQAMQGPSGAHLLGTDQLGRDVLSMLMRGLLTSYVVAAVGAAIAAVVGLPLGYAAAQWSAVPGQALVKASAALYGFPALLIAVLLAGAFGPGTPVAMLALGLAGLPAFAQAGHQTLQAVAGLAYVEAAELAGLSRVEVLRRHVGPEFGRALGVLVVGQIAVGIIGEAAIAFVGLGTQPPAASLGLILREGQAYLASKPELVIVPGLVIVIAVLALNAVAGGLRETLEVKLGRIGDVYGA